MFYCYTPPCTLSHCSWPSLTFKRCGIISRMKSLAWMLTSIPRQQDASHEIAVLRGRVACWNASLQCFAEGIGRVNFQLLFQMEEPSCIGQGTHVSRHGATKGFQHHKSLLPRYGNRVADNCRPWAASDKSLSAAFDWWQCQLSRQ